MEINAIPPTSPVECARYALKSRRQPLIVIQTGVIECNHQATPDDRLSERILPESRDYKRIVSPLWGF
jgi:hypothetical protein